MNYTTQYLLKAVTIIEFACKIYFNQDREIKKKMKHIYETGTWTF